MEAMVFYQCLKNLYDEPELKKNSYWSTLILKCAQIIMDADDEEKSFAESAYYFSKGVSGYYLKKDQSIPEDLLYLYHEIQKTASDYYTQNIKENTDEHLRYWNLARGLSSIGVYGGH